MLSNSELENILFSKFLDALRNIPSIQIIDIKKQFYKDSGESLDVVVTLDTSLGQWIMPIEIKSNVYPRDVREAVWRLNEFRYQNQQDTEIVPMFLAESISRGAKEELRNQNIGFYDSSGSLYLHYHSYYIDIQRIPPKMSKPVGIDLFTDSREMVVHALLQTQGQWVSGEELSVSSKTSVFTVSGVLHELELREWVIKSKQGGRLQRRKLVNPTALLDDWVKGRKKNKFSQTFGYIFASNTSSLMTKIVSKIDPDAMINGWAITGAFAANLASPLLTGVDVLDILVLPKFTNYFRNAIGMELVEKGYNVTLTECSDASLLYTKEERGISIASDFIQYLDLLDGRGRNAELAAQFRRDILGI